MALNTPRPGQETPPAGSVEEAREQILARVRRLPAEDVLLLDAAGRVLAADIVSPMDLWPFARSAMDGYALRAADTAGASPDRPVALRITGAVPAGSAPTAPVAAGSACRVATGAPIPAGADAVIPFELVRVDGDRLVLTTVVPAGKHVFPPGDDARRGEVLLPAGTVLRGGHLGLLAGLGIAAVPAFRRARVAVLAVGDELVEPDRLPGPAQIRESNSYALAGEILALGGEPLRLGIARDDAADLAAAIAAGLAADALIVTAGMSVGERDLVKEALVSAGVHLLFWRVPMKPGYPVAFGQCGDVLVFGLPGTPGAAMMAFEELVCPALRAIMGYRQVRPLWRPARLLEPITVRPGRHRYLWARAGAAEDGLVVSPLRAQSTATLRSSSDANAVIRVPAEISALAAGDTVEIRLRADPEEGDGAARRIPALAVVGAKNAGKTALIEHLLPELTRRGYRVGVIKHDPHGFEIDREGTDTWRAATAGAAAVAIAGPGRVAVLLRPPGEPPLNDVRAHLGGVDLLLLEGYSQERVPKVEVRRPGVTSEKPAPAGPCLAVVSARNGMDGTVTFDDIPALVDQVERALQLRRL
jgi:molybdopterin molybdotransferase